MAVEVAINDFVESCLFLKARVVCSFVSKISFTLLNSDLRYEHLTASYKNLFFFLYKSGRRGSGANLDRNE